MANFNLSENIFSNKDYAKDRGISILRFNERILDMAADFGTPLLESLNFIKIIENNIYEFLSIRVPDQKNYIYHIYKTQIIALHNRMSNVINDICSELTDVFGVSEFDEKTLSPITDAKYISNKIYIAYTSDRKNWNVSDGDDIPINQDIKNSFYFKLIDNHKTIYSNCGNDDKSAELEIRTMISDRENDSFLYALCSISDTTIASDILNGLGISAHDIIYTPDNVLRISSYINQYNSMPEDKSNEHNLYYPKADIDYEDIDEIDIVRKNKYMIYRVPYQSYCHIVNYISLLCHNNNTRFIFMTLYRVSSIESPIINALCDAVRANKKVFVYIERMARGDEKQNLDVASRLKDAGVKVITNCRGYKVHAKLFLALMANGEVFSHIGTGNYNESTAKVYTDTHILTNDRETGYGIMNIGLYLYGDRNVNLLSSKMFFSPFNSRIEILNQMDNEILKGSSGRIFLKCNSLCDKEIIDKLICADKAGVKINIIVRGIVTLLPTKNISIKSKVGRYLEHDRFYIIGDNVYISSADLLFRNMSKRIECVYKITDNQIKNKIIATFNSMWNSNIHYMNKSNYVWSRGPMIGE